MQKLSDLTQVHFYDKLKMEWSILETGKYGIILLWKLLYVSFTAGEVTC